MPAHGAEPVRSAADNRLKPSHQIDPSIEAIAAPACNQLHPSPPWSLQLPQQYASRPVNAGELGGVLQLFGQVHICHVLQLQTTARVV